MWDVKYLLSVTLFLVRPSFTLTMWDVKLIQLNEKQAKTIVLP